MKMAHGKTGTSMLRVFACALLAAALLGVFGLAGCSGGDQAKSSEGESPAQETSGPEDASEPAATVPQPNTSADAPYTVEAGETEAAKSFILENGTGQAVFGIAVRPAVSQGGSDEYVDCIFTVGDRLVPETRCLVRFDGADEGDGALFDLFITYPDGSGSELLDLPLAGLDAPLRVELSADGSAYVA